MNHGGGTSFAVAGPEDDEGVVTLVSDGSIAEPSRRHLEIEVEEEVSARPPEEARTPRGSTLSPELLARVDLAPKADAPQDSWGWEIAAYLYLGGLGAGAFIVAVLLDWSGLSLPSSPLAVTASWSWDWAAIFVYWGAAVTALGASLLIFHLGRNWRLFFTACFNPRSSWLARGFLILTTFIVVGGVAAVVAVFFPAWAHTVPIAWRGVQAVGLASACGTAIYTGVLLRSMKYIPAWNALLLPALFLASALSTGAMGIAVGVLLFRLVSSGPASVGPLVDRIETAEPAILAAEGLLLVLYLRHLVKGKPEARLSAAMLLSGAWRYRFWLGVVGCALLLPLLLAGLSALPTVARSSALAVGGVSFDPSDVLVLVAAASVLCGGFLLRLGVLAVGIKERPPLYGMSTWRAEHGLPLTGRDAGEGFGG